MKVLYFRAGVWLVCVIAGGMIGQHLGRWAGGGAQDSDAEATGFLFGIAGGIALADALLLPAPKHPHARGDLPAIPTGGVRAPDEVSPGTPAPAARRPFPASARRNVQE